MCAMKYPNFVYSTGKSVSFFTITKNIAVKSSDLLLLDWNEYLLYTMPRHHISLALSAVYFTSICKIASYFFSGADSGSSTMPSCKNEIQAHSHFV